MAILGSVQFGTVTHKAMQGGSGIFAVNLFLTKNGKKVNIRTSGGKFLVTTFPLRV